MTEPVTKTGQAVRFDLAKTTTADQLGAAYREVITNGPVVPGEPLGGYDYLGDC
ncbi:hypothetical protein [Georgenia sp. AZ-5]|uniref:hypothetical protein n=1 Tax=Georgenia sp. AZ-5 TaxID=3367526 RepID=UPI003754CE45